MRKLRSFDFTNTTISALVIIAAGLGIAIYIKNNPVLIKSTVKVAQRYEPNNLTDLEKRISDTPGMDSSNEVKEAYSNLINQNAVDGYSLVINDCKASPLVLRVRYGDEISVTNKGKNDIHFGFGDERTLVRSGQSQKIKINFKNGAGIYGYGCDDEAYDRSIGVLKVLK